MIISIKEGEIKLSQVMQKFREILKVCLLGANYLLENQLVFVLARHKVRVKSKDIGCLAREEHGIDIHRPGLHD